MWIRSARRHTRICSTRQITKRGYTLRRKTLLGPVLLACSSSAHAPSLCQPTKGKVMKKVMGLLAVLAMFVTTVQAETLAEAAARLKAAKKETLHGGSGGKVVAADVNHGAETVEQAVARRERRGLLFAQHQRPRWSGRRRKSTQPRSLRRALATSDTPAQTALTGTSSTTIGTTGSRASRFTTIPPALPTASSAACVRLLIVIREES